MVRPPGFENAEPPHRPIIPTRAFPPASPGLQALPSRRREDRRLWLKPPVHDLLQQPPRQTVPLSAPPPPSSVLTGHLGAEDTCTPSSGPGRPSPGRPLLLLLPPTPSPTQPGDTCSQGTPTQPVSHVHRRVPPAQRTPSPHGFVSLISAGRLPAAAETFIFTTQDRAQEASQGCGDHCNLGVPWPVEASPPLGPIVAGLLPASESQRPLFRRTPVIALGPTLLQRDLTPTSYTCNNPIPK